MSRSTVFSGRISYVEILVEERETNRVVWQLQFDHAANARVPDYGSRSQQAFISWVSDSSSVTIPVINDRRVTLPIE